MQDAKAMSDDAQKAAASAEEAYAKAAEAVGKKSAQEIVPETKKSGSPREENLSPGTEVNAASETTEVETKIMKPEKTEKPAKKASPKKKAPAPKRRAAAKPVPKPRTVQKPSAPLAPRPSVARPTDIDPASDTKSPLPITEPVTQTKEKPMAKSPEFTKSVSDAMAEIQSRTKEAYEKSTEIAGEASEFAKGNVEAIVESGKILTSGIQDLGKTYIDEAKSAFETLTADMKEIAAVKSPTDLFQLQGKLMRRNFDSFVAFGSKSSEAMVKLANESMSPISSRMSAAADKVAKVAA